MAQEHPPAQALKKETGGQVPRRIVVAGIVESRYLPGKRPLSWNERVPGEELVESADGEKLRLYSTAQQSTPAPGWELLLQSMRSDDRTPASGPLYSWTLYGIAPESTDEKLV